MEAQLINFFKRMNEALLPMDFLMEQSIEEFLLRRLSIHRLEDPELLRIFFFVVSQAVAGENGKFESTLEKLPVPRLPGEGPKEVKRRVGIAMETLGRMKIFKFQWTGEESFGIDAGNLIKFSSVFNAFNQAFWPMDHKFLKRLHDLLFKCLRVQQFGIIEVMRVFFYILSLINEEHRVSIREQELFEALARPDRKGDSAPSLFRLSLSLQELERKKAFSISWRKDGQPLRIDTEEVFIFLQGFNSLIKPAVVSTDFE